MLVKNFTFNSSPLPTNDLISINGVFTSPEDFALIQKQVGASSGELYIQIKGKILQLKTAQGIAPKSLAMGKVFRQMLQIGGTSADTIPFEYKYDRPPSKSSLTAIKFIVQLKSNTMSPVTLDETELAETIRNSYARTPMNNGHMLYLAYQGLNYFLIGSSLELDPQGPDSGSELKHLVSFGYLGNDTVIELASDSSNLKIKSREMKAKSVTKLGFKFDELGIGGLDVEISDIFRKVFTTRFYPAEYLKKYGIKHVKGMLLYGPPGTGKTLIARKLAEALEVKEFKVINGPELFDKYVGETEKKIRDLFLEAEKDQKENEDNAGIHVICFDEIDSICRARGTVNSGTGVHDGAVNQLLTKIDGVDSLNNIIVIGMTNRKDLIDEAILRPGRMEVHVEIGLPDDKGRLNILNIHTKSMRDNKVMGADVNLEEIAKRTKNFTGADIESLVKLACSNALCEHTNFQAEKIDLKQEHKVEKRHFLSAIDEIHPMFGFEKNEFENCYPGGIIDYGPSYRTLSESILTLFKQINESTSSTLISVLLEGGVGTGKTALAAYYALNSGVPYVKIISPESLVKFLEGGKYTSITQTFENAYKSPCSIIILDNIERIIEYIEIGPRFSNLILQTLMVYLKKIPPKKDRKLLIIGTTSMSTDLKLLGIRQAFGEIIKVDPLSKEEIIAALTKYEGEQEDKEKIANLVKIIPIKQLLYISDKALKRSNQLTFENFEIEYNKMNRNF